MQVIKKVTDLVNSHESLYPCIECIVGRLNNYVCMLVVDNFHVKFRYTHTQFFHMFLKVLLV